MLWQLAGAGEGRPGWIGASAPATSDPHSLGFTLLPAGTLHCRVTVASGGHLCPCVGMACSPGELLASRGLAKRARLSEGPFPQDTVSRLHFAV